MTIPVSQRETGDVMGDGGAGVCEQGQSSRVIKTERHDHRITGRLNPPDTPEQFRPETQHFEADEL